MSDPTPLVEHIYHMWIDNRLERMRNSIYKDDSLMHDSDDYYDEHFFSTDLFKSLYVESKVQLPGCALHNNNINYYDHTKDNIKKNTRDTTHVYTLSKLYMFLEMKAHVLFQIENREQEVRMPECVIVIRSPDATVINSLFMACKQISKYQDIVDLHMVRVICKYNFEPDVFKLSENARSLLLRSCSLPLQILNYIIHRLSECNTIQKIDIRKTNLGSVSSITLSNKTSLTHLDLRQTNMSADLCQSICQQLIDMNHLKYMSLAENDLSQVSKITLSKTLRYLNLESIEMSAELCQSILQQLIEISYLKYLNMSNNDLSQVSNFPLSNKKTLRYLYLENTHMSPRLYYTVYQQLTDFDGLKQFVVSRENSCYKICKEDEEPLKCFLSDEHLPTHLCRRIFHQINRFSSLCFIEITDSPLTGCVSSFLPNRHPGLPDFLLLQLVGTALNKKDLQHLFNIIQLNKLPQLCSLDLSDNTLTGFLSSFLPDPHPGLPQLAKLHLSHTELNKDDLQHLFSIIQSNKLPKLCGLHLSNNTLTGCLSGFLSDPHPGLPELTFLYLNHTALNKDDLQHLFSNIQSNKLPKLRLLDLSHNTLTGCLSGFLADPHPGLPELQWLDLDYTALDKDDLQHLLQIIQSHKLPNLGQLDLSQNTLT